MADSGKGINASATKGKKGKKKGVQMSLQEFIGTSNANAPVIQTSTNWADEMEHQNIDEEAAEYKINREALPSAPKSVLKAALDETQVPTVPPYTAFVSNLPFDVHLDDIHKFFKNLTINEIRMQKDGMGRSRGFGHIDFETRDMLISAIGLNELYIKTRPIKVSLQQERDKRDGDFRRDKDPEDDKTSGDWRRKEGGKKDDFDRDADKYGDNRGFSRGGERYGRQNEGNFEKQDRWKGGTDNYNNRDRYDNNNRDRYDNNNRDRYDNNNRDRYYNNNRGYDRDSQDRFSDNQSRYQNNRYERNDRNDRNDNRFERNDRPTDHTEREWRRKEPKDEGRRADSNDRSSASEKPRYSDSRGRDENRPAPARPQHTRDPSPPAREAPKERTKLNLKPRTKPLEATAPTSTSSIFGDARPVDTAAKERELEEKLKQKHAESKTSRDRRTSEEGSHPAYNRQVSSESAQSNTTSEPSEEQVKVVPAPPPKVNAWAARRSQQTQQPKPQHSQSDTIANNCDTHLHKDNTRPYNYERSNAWSEDSKEQPGRGRSQEGPNSSQSTSAMQQRREGGRGGAEGGPPGPRGVVKGQPESAVGKGIGRGKHVPQSIDDLPKLETKSKKDWSNKNKFDTLLSDEEERGGKPENDENHSDINKQDDSNKHHHTDNKKDDDNDDDDDDDNNNDDSNSWSQVSYSKAHERLEP